MIPVVAFAVFLLVVVAAVTIPRLIHKCGPNEVVVFSGRGKGGKPYRLFVRGGYGVRVPLFEVVDRIDLSNMNIEIAIQNAYAKGGVPLNIQAIGNVKVSGESPGLDNALQRLLGKPKPLIMRIAKETLSGYLRGVMATLTPEELNEDTQAFEKELRRQAGEGLDRLGITLDNLKIQSISDDVGYLTAMGRVRNAELNRENRIAEAQRRAESLVSQAEARREGELARIEAQINIARAEADRRISNAQTARHAYVAEQEGEVAALLTRAKAELDMWDARIEQAKHQMEAEIVTPAQADMEARIAKARGDAAPVLERGRAQAQALQDLAKQWKAAGPAAKDIFVLQKLETILPTFLESISRVRVDDVTMLQGSGDDGTLAHQAIGTVKALEAGGIDVSGLLDRLGGGAAGSGGGGLSAPPGTRSSGRSKRGSAPPPPPPAPLSQNRGFTQTRQSSGGPPKARLIRKRES